MKSTASRTSPTALASVLPASRTASATKRARSASSRSAARSRHAARSAAGVRDHSVPASAATPIAVATSAAAVSATRADRIGSVGGIDDVLHGVCTGRRVGARDIRQKRRRIVELRSGGELVCERGERRRRRRGPRPSSCVAPAAARPASADSRAATPPVRSAATTGSSTSDAMLTAGSTIRLTNDELAPFSSSRRTRYASSVSCEPTGA